MRILVTGGAGYIGSHTCIELQQAGHELVVMDNLSNSCVEALARVKEVSGKQLEFHQLDLLDQAGLKRLFELHEFQCVIHFAGLKAVGESVAKPLEYYRNNVAGTLNLCSAMRTAGVKNIIFSSSATVYGEPDQVPIKETDPVGATANPYGRTKFHIEEILTDLCRADSDWNVVLLRYFNPVGAHPSGRLGEDPAGIPNNLMPYIAQVAVGKLEEVAVFGNDYPTPDGTPVRDYIHVVDLARGHVRALQAIEEGVGLVVYNLGTGRGYSVLEVLDAFRRSSGRDIPHQIAERRPGDVAETYADAGKAARELNWRAELSLDDMCADSWRWQQSNPQGYR